MSIEKWVEMVNESARIEGDIRELRDKQQAIDYRLKEEIVRSGSFDLLKVNKDRIRKIAHLDGHLTEPDNNKTHQVKAIKAINYKD